MASPDEKHHGKTKNLNLSFILSFLRAGKDGRAAAAAPASRRPLQTVQSPLKAGPPVWQVDRKKGILRNEPPLLASSDGPIMKVHKGRPFADGLHESDIITAIDKQQTPSKVRFRKVLAFQARRVAPSEPEA